MVLAQGDDGPLFFDNLPAQGEKPDYDWGSNGGTSLPPYSAHPLLILLLFTLILK